MEKNSVIAVGGTHLLFPDLSIPALILLLSPASDFIRYSYSCFSTTTIHLQPLQSKPVKKQDVKPTGTYDTVISFTAAVQQHYHDTATAASVQTSKKGGCKNKNLPVLYIAKIKRLTPTVQYYSWTGVPRAEAGDPGVSGLPLTATVVATVRTAVRNFSSQVGFILRTVY
jgi:hypothetical protein